MSRMDKFAASLLIVRQAARCEEQGMEVLEARDFVILLAVCAIIVRTMKRIQFCRKE